MSKILDIVARWAGDPRNDYTQGAETITAIENAEIRRLQLEDKYMPTEQVWLCAVNIPRAVEHLQANGCELHVIETGLMWVCVRLNPIEAGLLRECHIDGVRIRPIRYELPIVTEEDIDYERIG